MVSIFTSKSSCTSFLFHLKPITLEVGVYKYENITDTTHYYISPLQFN